MKILNLIWAILFSASLQRQGVTQTIRGEVLDLYLNIDNVTNTKGRLSEFYDAGEPNSIGYVKQFGFFPNLMYRVYF